MKAIHTCENSADFFVDFSHIRSDKHLFENRLFRKEFSFLARFLSCQLTFINATFEYSNTKTKNSNLLEEQELHEENLAEKETQHRELKGQNEHISMTLIEAENYKGQNLI